MDKNIVFATNGAERMRVLSDGNVGIGTNSPASKLDVRGNIQNVGTTSLLGSIGIGTTAGSTDLIAQVGTCRSDIYGGIRIYGKRESNGDNWGSCALYMQFHVDATPFGYLKFMAYELLYNRRFIVGYNKDERGGIFLDNEEAYGGAPCIQSVTSTWETNKLAINPAGGNVGIGTTNPSHRLHVWGDSTIEGTLIVKGADFNLGSAGTGRGSGGRALVHDHGNRLVMNYGNDFNGGIALLGKVDVAGSFGVNTGGIANGLSDNIFFRVQAEDSVNGDGSRWIYSNSIDLKAGDLAWSTIRSHGAGIYIGGGASDRGAINHGAINFKTAGATRMTVAGNGDVGIKTTSPEATLHVAGTLLTDWTIKSLGTDFIISNQYRGSGGRALVHHTSNILVINYGNDFSGGVQVGSSMYVGGTLTAASKNFDIQHPLHPENENKRLVHGCVEGPRNDLLYRGSVQLVNGRAVVNIDRDSSRHRMSDGTFEALCRDPVVYLQNNDSFDRVIGKISGATLTIICENSSSYDAIDWMVVADRKDKTIVESNMTDAEGYLITEYTK